MQRADIQIRRLEALLNGLPRLLQKSGMQAMAGSQLNLAIQIEHIKGGKLTGVTFEIEI